MNKRPPSTSETRPPSRPVIAPGLPVVARPDGELQIGLGARHRLRIPDSTVARRTLAALARGERPEDTAALRQLRRLGPVVRDGGTLVQPGLPESEMAALVLNHPHSALARLAARQSTAVRVMGDLDLDPRPLLAASGLAAGTTVDTTAGRTVALVLCAGEPDRTVLDPLLRERQPHLVLRAVEGELVLGPFVAPGQTACLRCVDAHLAEEDPHHPLLVSSAARVVPAPKAPEPVEAALAAIALGWAVRDLVRYAEGDPVSTWSATVRVGPDDVELAPQQWLPHPACGCAWARAWERPSRHDRSRTMGA